MTIGRAGHRPGDLTGKENFLPRRCVAEYHADRKSIMPQQLLRAALVSLLLSGPTFAQLPVPGGIPRPLPSLPLGSVPVLLVPPKSPDPIEKLGDNLYRLGSVRGTTATRELTVSGKVNTAAGLEFIANTKNGFKAYECAIELDTNGLTFNVAMILIGLDKTRMTLASWRAAVRRPSQGG